MGQLTYFAIRAVTLLGSTYHPGQVIHDVDKIKYINSLVQNGQVGCFPSQLGVIDDTTGTTTSSEGVGRDAEALQPESGGDSGSSGGDTTTSGDTAASSSSSSGTATGGDTASDTAAVKKKVPALPKK